MNPDTFVNSLDRIDPRLPTIIGADSAFLWSDALGRFLDPWAPRAG